MSRSSARGCSFLAVMLFLHPGSGAATASDRLFESIPGWCRGRFEDPIETDRHDFTQSSRTLDRGVSQFEFGYTYFYKDAEEEIDSTHTLPELAFRYGLTDDVEFKLRWNYAWRFSEHDQFDSAEDMRLAIKFQLTENECWIPETALILRGSVPTGGDVWSLDSAQPGIALVYTWELAERVTLSAQSSANNNGLGDISLEEANLGERDHFVALSQSAALGVPLGPQNEVYVEWFGIWSHGLEDAFVQHFVNVGIDHYVTEDFVLDLRVGKGLTDDSEDLFVGVGGGVRY